MCINHVSKPRREQFGTWCDSICSRLAGADIQCGRTLGCCRGASKFEPKHVQLSILSRRAKTQHTSFSPTKRLVRITLYWLREEILCTRFKSFQYSDLWRNHKAIFKFVRNGCTKKIWLIFLCHVQKKSFIQKNFYCELIEILLSGKHFGADDETKQSLHLNRDTGQHAFRLVKHKWFYSC